MQDRVCTEFPDLGSWVIYGEMLKFAQPRDQGYKRSCSSMEKALGKTFCFPAPRQTGQISVCSAPAWRRCHLQFQTEFSVSGDVEKRYTDDHG